MFLVKPSVEILAAHGYDDDDFPCTYQRPLELIEAAGRTCYKSEDKAWTVCPTCHGATVVPVREDYQAQCGNCRGGLYSTSANKFYDMLEHRGHFAMIEHSWEVWCLPRGKAGFLTRSAPSPFIVMIKHGDFLYFAGNRRAFDEWSLGEEVRRQGDVIDSLTGAQLRAFPSLAAFTAKIVCDRGVTHEIVRHRPASYAQESTRYCNYGGGVTFVIPPWVDMWPGEFEPAWDEGLFGHLPDKADDFPGGDAGWWFWHCAVAERDYQNLLARGWSPQQARSVLPNSTKTEIVVTASLAEWRHIFKLRCDKAAHPQMQEVMIPLRDKAAELYPEIFKAV